MDVISETDLILNDDGSAYHISLLPEDVAETVITVGDPDRVAQISKYFDKIEGRKGKREFITHTGYIGKQRLTVISTGIGTGNIDIVLNELDALVNIDLKTRKPKPEPKSLNIVRIGTSGAIRADIAVDSLLVSTLAFGLDPLMHFYKQELSLPDQELLAAFMAILPVELKYSPYLAAADKNMLTKYADGITHAITITSPGFYAPQGRKLRIDNAFDNLVSIFSQFEFAGRKIANLEMETAGIYGLAGSLGHKAISFSVILANRITRKFSKDPGKTIDNYIRQILERLSK